MLRNEEKSSTAILLTLNTVPALSHHQKWIEFHKNLDFYRYPISKKIYDLYSKKLRAENTVENNESFFKEAEKLFIIIKKSEDSIYSGRGHYKLNQLLAEVCEDAYEELVSDSVASTQDIKDIQLVVQSSEKLKDALDKNQPTYANNDNSKAYDSLYFAGKNLYYESATLAYDILKSPSVERKNELKALNGSLKHAAAVVLDPIRNQRNIALLREDSRIVRDTPNHWAKFKGFIALLASAALVVAGLAIMGIAIPLGMGTSLPAPSSEAANVIGSIGIGSSSAACFMLGIALFGKSVNFFVEGFHKPVSNSFSHLAETAENIKQYRA